MLNNFLSRNLYGKFHNVANGLSLVNYLLQKLISEMSDFGTSTSFARRGLKISIFPLICFFFLIRRQGFTNKTGAGFVRFLGKQWELFLGLTYLAQRTRLCINFLSKFCQSFVKV